MILVDWIVEKLDNWSYMSVETFFENPNYGNKDRTNEFLKSHNLKRR